MRLFLLVFWRSLYVEDNVIFIIVIENILKGLSIINYPTVCLCVGLWVCDRTPPKRRLQS